MIFITNLLFLRHVRGHSITTFTFRGRGTREGFIKMGTYVNKGTRVSHQCECSHIIFLTEYLIHKPLTIVTRFFVSFIKIPVLLKISALKKLHLVHA